MERRLSEEQVTKIIIRWLVEKGWVILSFDFPQSGTGRALHPDLTDSKTAGIIIPDIIAYRNGTLVFFENKDRFVLSDFEKVFELRRTDSYHKAIQNLAKGYSFEHVCYGIGIPHSNGNEKKIQKHLDKVDFVILVEDREKLIVSYDCCKLFLGDF